MFLGSYFFLLFSLRVGAGSFLGVYEDLNRGVAPCTILRLVTASNSEDMSLFARSAFLMYLLECLVGSKLSEVFFACVLRGFC